MKWRSSALLVLINKEILMKMKWLIAFLPFVAFQAGALTLTTEEYPPLNFTTDGGKTVSGLATDVMREVIKRTGIKATISLYPWQRSYKEAQDDKDTCVYSTTRTDAREKLFKWVGPLAPSTWILFAKADSAINIKTLDEAKKFKIGGYQGDAKAAFLKEKGLTLDEAMNDEQNIKKLDAGRIDLWAATSGIGPWMAKNSGIKIKPILSFQEVQMFAACNLSMPDADISKMNDAIKAIKADGTYEKIIKAYQ
jgi:polar amino acid transport system substrate-binding protein